MGDKGQKENIAITLTGVTFTTELPGVLTDYLAPRTNAQEYALPAGMVYAKVSFNLENLSKQEINVPSIELKTDVVLDYNDGFRYATHDNAKSYFVSDTEWVIHEDAGGQMGADIAVAPLMRKSFDVYIACPEIIATDEEAPLLVSIISSYESQVYYYEYTVR